MSYAEDKLVVKVWVLSKDKSALTWSSVSSLTNDISEEHVSQYGMAKLGRFLGWETAMQMDTKWNRLLYSWSPEVLK